MTPEESKRRQKLDAATRAAAATATNTESQVTKAAPQVYRAPRINVPANRHEFAKLIEAELTKIEGAQSAIMSLLNERPNGLKYVDGTIVVVANDTRDFPIQLEQRKSGAGNYMRLYGASSMQGGMGVTPGSNDIHLWSEIGGSSFTAGEDGEARVSDRRRQFLDGSASVYRGDTTHGVAMSSLIDSYVGQPGGYGSVFTDSANAAPVDTTIFMRSSANNALGLDGILRTHGGLGGSYQAQQFTAYSAYVQGVDYTRTRNGDNGAWDYWQASHVNYKGGTAGMDWNNVGYFNDPTSVRARGYMEVRQFDDANGPGNASPANGYGTALMWSGGLFATQMAYSSGGTAMWMRGSYAGTPESTGWCRFVYVPAIKAEIYAELLGAGIIDEARHALLVAAIEVTEGRERMKRPTTVYNC